jgi:hypothetical protein
MLRDRIFTEPASFFLGCLVWIPLAIWIISLVRWMIGGEMDVLFGFIGIGVALILGTLAIRPPAPQYSIVTFAAVAGTVVMFPFLRRALNQRSLRSIDMEDLVRAHEMLRLRPDNVSAKFKIARLLYEMGYPGHALRIAENCIATMPQAFFLEEHRVVARWRVTPTHPSAFNPLPCIECGHPNQPGNVNCAACGSPFLLDRLRGKLLPSNLAKKLMMAWAIMVMTLVSLPLLKSVGGIGAIIGMLLVPALAFVALVYLLHFADKRTT